MKILITESQLKYLVNNIIKEDQDNSLKLREKYAKMEDWFVPILNQLTEKTDPNSIFYVNINNNEVYMEYDKKTKYLWVNYIKIWSYFYKNYSSNHEEIRKLMKGLVGEHLSLWDATPRQYLGPL